MTTIVLTEEQARVLAEAEERVTVQRPDGSPVGVFEPGEAAIIAEAKRRLADGRPGVPWERVQVHMRLLQAERERLGPAFDQAYMLAFLAGLRAGDANG